MQELTPVQRTYQHRATGAIRVAFAALALAVSGCGVGVADNNFFAPPPLAEDTASDDSSTGGIDSSISASSSASAETSAGEGSEATTSVDPSDTSDDEESTGSTGTSGSESGDPGGALSEFPAGTTTWRGIYSCAQGETRLELVLTRVEDGDGLEGVFAFAPTISNPEVEEGSFSVSGSHAPADGAVDLVPGAWIEQPEGWTTISLAGTLDPLTMTISGDVLDPECSTFNVGLE